MAWRKYWGALHESSPSIPTFRAAPILHMHRHAGDGRAGECAAGWAVLVSRHVRSHMLVQIVRILEESAAFAAFVFKPTVAMACPMAATTTAKAKVTVSRCPVGAMTAVRHGNS